MSWKDEQMKGGLYDKINTRKADETNRWYYQNSAKIEETEFRTALTDAAGMWETGGKEALFYAEQGDTFFLKTEQNDNIIFNIITCFEFVSV